MWYFAGILKLYFSYDLERIQDVNVLRRLKGYFISPKCIHSDI